MPQKTQTTTSDQKNILETLDIYKIYKTSPYLSIKHASYFHTYSEIFQVYRNKKITFVEVGVLNGGSLFMWRNYFGKDARIIGVDLNPEAKKWEEDGFEIFIGSQSHPEFWEKFFEEIGNIDIILDDGGHTYEQQIITVHSSVNHVNDGGLIVVEDAHTSYLKEFGYPSRYTFMEWSKTLIDNINSRFPETKKNFLRYKDHIQSICFFESIVAFKINRQCCFNNFPVSNNGKSSQADDFRYSGSILESISKNTLKKYTFLRKIPGINQISRLIIKLHAHYRAIKYLSKYFQ